MTAELAVASQRRARALRCAVFAFAFAFAFGMTAAARASIGLTELPAKLDAGAVTVFYPSSAAPRVEYRGLFDLRVAVDGPAEAGNGRLIVISHGSPAPPWVHYDLARTLVEAGYVVALPEHRGDNPKDPSDAGPTSWRRRPVEISRAIDRVGADPRFLASLELDKVGMFGMSAGGHTALTLAGGRWSEDLLRRHCNAHAKDDFQACAGPSTKLTGNALDRLKIALVRRITDWRLTDTTLQSHTDPRIAAIVAGVPFAADFDPESLRQPLVPLGLVTVRLDRWLVPAYHGDAVLKACGRCERLADLPTGGHGALLSPLPPGREGLIGELTADPPGFDRATALPEIHRRIRAFFDRHLLSVGDARETDATARMAKPLR